MSRKKKKKAPLVAEFNPPKVVKYLGNRNTKELHLMAWAGGSCNLDDIVEREEFDDFETAVKAGFRGCGHCLQGFDKGEAPHVDGD